MRRLINLACVAAAAGLLAVAVPSSAQAAQGILKVGGVFIEDPSGCYGNRTDKGEPGRSVKNGTNQEVRVYGSVNCSGHVVDVIPSGGAGRLPGGGIMSSFHVK